jgi:hypothetical protein
MIRRPCVWGRTGTKRRRSKVSPSEGNEARREGCQEVAASRSSDEAGERPFRTPGSEGDAALWAGSWNHAEDTVPHKRVTAKRPNRVRDSDHNVTNRVHLTCTPGRAEQTAHLVTPRQTPSELPIIGLPALLQLVEWHQKRRRSNPQGGLSCANLEPSLSPPAPEPTRPSSRSPAALVDLPRRATRTNSRRTDPRRRPTTGEASRRQGGDA